MGEYHNKPDNINMVELVQNFSFFPQKFEVALLELCFIKNFDSDFFG